MILAEERALLEVDTHTEHDEMDCGCVLARDEVDAMKVGFVPCGRHRRVLEEEDDDGTHGFVIGREEDIEA